MQQGIKQQPHQKLKSISKCSKSTYGKLVYFLHFFLTDIIAQYVYKKIVIVLKISNWEMYWLTQIQICLMQGIALSLKKILELVTINMVPFKKIHN